MVNRLVVFVLLFLCCQLLIGQELTSSRNRFRYEIQSHSKRIKVDGLHDSDEWEEFDMIHELYNHNPIDKGLSTKETRIKMTYNHQMLFIGAWIYDNGDRVVQSLQRDSDNAHWNSDSFSVVIDPINSKQHGVLFGVNAGGAEIDGTLSVESSQTLYSETWDEKWYSAVGHYKDHWFVEIAIPFNSLRYTKDNDQWGINFIRTDKTANFYYTWTEFPVNFNAIDLNYMGTLSWSKPPEVKAKRFFVKPYVTGIYNEGRVEGASVDTDLEIGGDVKVPITRSLYADLSINPDFSNADVDQEIVNISRFDISLPERRDFFLENNDVFSNFGNENIRPFFSRRIGLANGERVPIVYGGKLTGNLGRNLRVGLMDIRTASTETMDPVQNTIGSFHYRVFKRSSIKGLYINRSILDENGYEQDSRNLGGEFSYISDDGKLNNIIMFHTSQTKGLPSGHFLGMEGSYSSRGFGAGWVFNQVNDSFRADLGFVPRTFVYNAEEGRLIRQGYTQINPWMKFTFFPKSGVLNTHSIRTWHHIYYFNRNPNERQYNLAYDTFFKNTGSFTISLNHSDIDLMYPTNFLGDNYDNLPADNYTHWRTNLSYNSDIRRRLSYALGINMGTFYNGNRLTVTSSTNLRFGYWGNFGISYDMNNIDLPENYGKTLLHLIRFNGSISFSNKLFLNSAVQYNSFNRNFSIFSKLQWRFSPLSDIFLIYNQNNETDDFTLSHRALMIKVTYRFGI